MPRLFDENILPLDAAFIQVSPPDTHGYCSLGISVEVTRAAIRNAKKVFAQINRNMPRVHGDTFVHMNEIDAYVEYDEPLIELNYTKKITELEKTIGKKVAELIEDRSTRKFCLFFGHTEIIYLEFLVQLGIGPIPDCILTSLNNHKDLNIATEMLSDGVIPLIEKGIVTNKYKKFYPGKTTCTFMLGTKKLYDFVDDNPSVLSLDVSSTNDPAQIRRNPRMCAINSALEIDLTGQICADSLGTIQYSGVGGQMDFMRGAALSEHGKPIIVLPSQSSKGVSRIVNTVEFFYEIKSH
jgi:acyl-CoA hydrolase